MRKILIIEDEKNTIKLISKALQELVDEGYEIISAENGKSGIELAREARPDLILLDIILSDIDGIEVCRSLKSEKNFEFIPIVMLTGMTNIEKIVEGLSNGANDYITKPFELPELRARVKSHLRMKEMNETARRKEEEKSKANIIKRKQAENELSDSEERYRSLVQALPDIVFKIDLEGRFLFISDFAQNWGYREDELIGKHFSEIIHPDDVEAISRFFVLQKYKGKETGDEDAPKLFDERRTGERITKNLKARFIRNNHEGANKNFANAYGLITTYGELSTVGLYDNQSKEKKIIGTVGIIRDVTERKQAEIALENYSKKLVESQETERKRIAAELHDSLGVSLVTVKNEIINCIDSPLGQIRSAKKMEAVIETIDQIIEDIRNISHNLRPENIDILGLEGAVKSLVNKISDSSSIDISLNLKLKDSKISPNIEINLYRITQEGLANILKHSKADKASIKLKFSGGFIELWISDNGKGLEAKQKNIPFDTEKGLGLYGMAERTKNIGGSFELESNPGKGTTLKVKVRVDGK